MTKPSLTPVEDAQRAMMASLPPAPDPIAQAIRNVVIAYTLECAQMMDRNLNPAAMINLASSVIASITHSCASNVLNSFDDFPLDRDGIYRTILGPVVPVLKTRAPDVSYSTTVDTPDSGSA